MTRGYDRRDMSSKSIVLVSSLGKAPFVDDGVLMGQMQMLDKYYQGTLDLDLGMSRFYGYMS